VTVTETWSEAWAEVTETETLAASETETEILAASATETATNPAVE
jgi:hypothetical protein